MLILPCAAVRMGTHGVTAAHVVLATECMLPAQPEKRWLGGTARARSSRRPTWTSAPYSPSSPRTSGSQCSSSARSRCVSLHQRRGTFIGVLNQRTPQPKEIGLPFTAYYAVDEVRDDGTEKSQKVFLSVPTEVSQTEAEEIGGRSRPLDLWERGRLSGC